IPLMEKKAYLQIFLEISYLYNFEKNFYLDIL
ncbi:unnamed protein product, partial [marine sediment metagenome]